MSLRSNTRKHICRMLICSAKDYIIGPIVLHNSILQKQSVKDQFENIGIFPIARQGIVNHLVVTLKYPSSVKDQLYFLQ